MSIINASKVNYQLMVILAIVVGGLSILVQFLPGFELLSFMLSTAVLGGLIGGSSGYEERDRQQLARSYKTAYEWLLLIVLVAFAVIELARWVRIEGVVVFLNNHWPGLMIASMCFLMGIAGLQKREDRPGM
jgi:hypothetical protein